MYRNVHQQRNLGEAELFSIFSSFNYTLMWGCGPISTSWLLHFEYFSSHKNGNRTTIPRIEMHFHGIKFEITADILSILYNAAISYKIVMKLKIIKFIHSIHDENEPCLQWVE